MKHSVLVDNALYTAVSRLVSSIDLAPITLHAGVDRSFWDRPIRLGGMHKQAVLVLPERFDVSEPTFKTKRSPLEYNYHVKKLAKRAAYQSPSNLSLRPSVRF